jgi:uncharacterized protein (DUF924 family)
MDPSPTDVITFWREAGPSRWFRKDDDFDRRFRERFETAHDAAAAGRLADWAGTADGALALLILLDQFPRNAYRDTPRMFATDPQAVAIADAALCDGFDTRVDPALRAFFCMPFMHSERLADQQRCVALATPLGAQTLRFALIHLEIIERFGRFPHRNALLGRTTTAAEQQFLDEGGFSG